jgi:beta-mannosidase
METLDLAGWWEVRSDDGRLSHQGMVPGTLFGDLERLGYFGPGGLSWRENNRQCVDIVRQGFTWSRSLTVPPGWADRPVVLECDGLDTLATVKINGRVVGQTKNMHRRYRFDVGAFLVPGANIVEVWFADSLEYIRQERRRRNLWHAYEAVPEIGHPGFNMIRKSHCSYGWDWGPIVPDVGIWRSIRLVCTDGARIADLRVVQDHRDGVVLEVRAVLEPFADGSVAVTSTLIHPDGLTQEADHDASGLLRLPVDSPRLWWPNGLGDQPIYTLETRCRRDGKVLDSRTLTLGLRTLTVGREADEWGQKFEFVVNGKPFFAMGGDYIPEDVALARVTREQTAALVQDCVDAHFNCLRVWGGGVYPSDDFFDLCDRAGLVVWQDLMFACAVYDVKNPEFRAEIAAEVKDNLERIRHRACLGLVCGNNEMEQGFVEWDIRPTPEQRTEYLTQYQVLFPQIMAETAPDVFYWPASPSSGGDFDAPNAPDRGDCHFWAVWHGNKDFSEYTRHFFRFMSEFGFESFPSLKTIEGFTEPGDRNVFSPVMEDHQRCVGGNGKIFTSISKYFRYPKDFASVVYVSQVSQAEAQRSGIEHWRRHRGRCMGSVYWQVNDNWPVASWSSIDSQGRWKLMHYAARRAYAPRLFTCVAVPSAGVALPEGNGHFTPEAALVEFHLSNEGLTAARGTWSWQLCDTDARVLAEGTGTAEAGPTASACVGRLDLTDRICGREAPRRALLFYRLDLGAEVLTGCHAFVPYKMVDLRPAPVTVVWVPGPGPLGSLEVSSDVPALFVEVEHRAGDAVLSDNGFSLRGRRRVEILRTRNSDTPWWTTGWTARSLVDSY